MPILGTIASSRASFSSGPLAYESIATVSVGAGGASTVTFNSIPSTFAHLQLRYVSKDARSGADAPVDLRFNGDTSAIYDKRFIQADGGTSSTNTELAQSYLRLEGGGNTSPVEVYGIGITDILDYKATNKFKTVYQCAGIDKNGSGGFARLNVGQYRSNNAVTSITLIPFASPFAQFSHFALYGIKES